MELSPRLLRDVEFGEKLRGYNEAEVDEFLERVAVALEALIERFQETNARAEAAERRLLERGDDDEIRRTLLLAQRTAAAAVEDARTEAERIVADADTAVAERLAAAEERLHAIETEIAERTRSELAALEERRAALAADVDALSAFVDEHRNRLAGELRRELAWLERPELEVPQPAGLRAQPQPCDPERAAAPGGDVATPETAAAEQALAGAEEAHEPQLQAEAGAVAPADARGAAPDLAVAREELERALADADPGGDPGQGAAQGRQIFDVLADDDDASGGSDAAGEDTGVFDVVTDDEEDASGPAGGGDELQWRDEPEADQAGADDDPFLTELRKAITDDDPLGPRDHDPQLHAGDDDAEPAGSGWFRRRQRD
jgi:DivIVA domain-containing protein